MASLRRSQGERCAADSAGFTVFLLCLILGVAAIAAVGTVRDSIRAALDEQGAVLLGGDAQASFTYRAASPEERAYLEIALHRPLRNLRLPLDGRGGAGYQRRPRPDAGQICR